MDSATYTYWPQGWLKKVTYNDLSTIEYFYDDAGNRTSVVVTPPPPLAPLAATSNTSEATP